MEIVDAENHRAALESEIARHANCHVDLVIVDDVESWAATRIGNAKDNPPAMAIIDGETGAYQCMCLFPRMRGCRVRLRPKPGDCCVFCSYGSVRCPPKQLALSCCANSAMVGP